MNVRNLFVAMLVLAGFSTPWLALADDSDLVHVQLRIVQLAEENQVISAPSIVVKVGEWASVNHVNELLYPTEYDPAIVPKAHAARLSSGEDGKLKEGDSIALIPPFPNNYESRDLGLKLRVRPVREGNRIKVEVKCEQAALHGFINYGMPISFKRKGALGKERSKELIANQILMPEFQNRLTTYTVIAGSGKKTFDLQRPETPIDDVQYTDFAAEFSERGIPPLRLEIEAKQVETGLDPLPVAASDAANETRSIPAMKHALAVIGDPAAAEFKERLAKLGIEIEDAKLDAEEQLVVTASATALNRLTKLLKTYESDPQLYVTLKFIESDEPLDHLDGPLMTDPQYQVFIRTINQMKGVDLLSAPSVMTRPFQKAKIEVVREHIYPINYDPPKVHPADAEADSKSAHSFPVTPAAPKEFKTRNVGVTFEVEPLLHEDGSIELHAWPQAVATAGNLNFGQPIHILEIGQLGKPRLIQISGNASTVPVFERREMQTHVRIPDGRSVIQGGIVTTRTVSVEDRVPVLSSIPIVGSLTKKETEIVGPRYLYVVMTVKRMEGLRAPSAGAN